jgi:hypothetical protein
MGMKILFILLFALQTHAAANEISGQITLAKGATLKPGGVLFIFARKGESGMPASVLRITEPKFPLKFSLSEKNAMAPGIPFDGPFTVTARYSPAGDVMDKSGPQGASAKPVPVGARDVKIELKAK